MTNRTSPRVTTLGEAMNKPVAPQQWAVDRLFRIGKKRMNLIAGPSEAGKSTLALQLAVATAKGIPFLGRETKRAPVMYWQCEEDVDDIAPAARLLGYDSNADEPIYTPESNYSDENNLLALRDALRQHPECRLVLIETLDELLKFDEVLSNTDARKGFDAFEKHVGSEFHSSMCFIALHHFRKNESLDSGNRLLGATGIRARTDAKLYLTSGGDADPRRSVLATVRRGGGKAIPKTYTTFDELTGTATLGLTAAEDKKANAGNQDERILGEILDYFASHPQSSFENDCLPAVIGNGDNKRRVFKKALRDGLLEPAGKGLRGSKRTYSLRPSSIPFDEATPSAANAGSSIPLATVEPAVIKLVTVPGIELVTVPSARKVAA